MKIIFLKINVFIVMIIMLELVQAQKQLPGNYSSSSVNTAPTDIPSYIPADGSKALLFSESFNGTVFPPVGWANIQVSGTGLWARSTSGTYPPCSPHSGAGMAYFNSYDFDAGTTALLVSPIINFVSDSNKIVDFWMYRDPGLSNASDSIGIYCNTASNLTGARFLGNVLRYNSTAGWFHYTYIVPPSVHGNYHLIFKAYSDYGNNMYIDDISVTGPNIKDVGVSSILFPEAGMLPGTIIPQVFIKNYGNISQTNIPVSYKIGPNGTLHTVIVPSLASGASTYVAFPAWNAELGTYKFIFFTDLFEDGVRTNDTLKRDLTVVSKLNKAFCFKENTQPASFILENPIGGFTDVGVRVPWLSRAGVFFSTSETSYKWLVLGSDKNLYSIDTLNGVVNIIGATGAPDPFLSGLTFDKGTRTLYASGLSGSYPAFTFKLYIVNQTTGAATLVATSPTTGCFFEIACNNEGQLFAIENRPSAPGRLYSLNKTTAALTLIGTDLGGNISSNPQDIEFNDNNILYFAASLGSDGILDGLYTINTSTGRATLVSTFKTTNTAVVGLGIVTAYGASIKETSNEKNEITLFPNPISDFVSIISENKEMIRTVNVISLSGQLIYSENPNHIATTINTSIMSAGFYFVQVKTDSGTFTKKITIIK